MPQFRTNKMYDPRKILEYIVQFKIKYDGNSPTIREIRDNCHLSSTSVAHNILERLEKQGKIVLVKLTDRRTRLIIVVGGVWNPPRIDPRRDPQWVKV